MKTYIRCKQHKNSTPKHKIIKTTTEVSPWNDQLYKISTEEKRTKVVSLCVCVERVTLPLKPMSFSLILVFKNVFKLNKRTKDIKYVTERHN